MIMIVYVILLNLLLVTNTVKSEVCGENPPFKYRIERFTNNFTVPQITEHHVSNVITNDKLGYFIELEEDMKYLCKGTLNITVRCHHLWAPERGIEVIEPGVFDNQKLDSQLRLSYNLIKIIRKGTFVNMEITDLELNNNQIVLVEEGAFENLPNLSVLYLHRNQILEFQPNTISNTPMMFSLSLGQNKLKKLEENSLGFFKRNGPVVMDVSDNEIEAIHPNTFGNVIKFVALYLAGNNLESLPKELFENQEYSLLNISHNKLTTLPKEFFNMKGTRDVDLEGNNLDCDTIKNIKLYEELSKNNVKFNDTTKANNC